MKTDVIAFGEVLWDIIDGVPHIGGAPFNFAAHVVKCGLSASIVSAVGNDELGRRARDAVKRLGVGDATLVTHPTLPTGTVNVTLQGGFPSYEIVRPVAWDEIALDDAAAIETPRAFYFGSLAQRSPVSAKTLRALLRWGGEPPLPRRGGIPAAPTEPLVFFDVNLRQDYWSRELIDDSLPLTDILKVNDEEMRTLGFEPSKLFSLYPRLQTVIETRGAAGCAVWSRTGAHFTNPAVPDGSVVDTVGAGDSFSAAFLASVLKGASLEEAARAGNVRAGQVAARAGAIPDDLGRARSPSAPDSSPAGRVTSTMSPLPPNAAVSSKPPYQPEPRF